MPICTSKRVAMNNRMAENTFRCLLAAWMLVATSTMSSTYVHGHNGGNVSHQHDSCESTLPHSTATAAFHNDHDSSIYVGHSARDVHRHGGLVLLGAFAYQPLSDKSSDSQDKSPIGWQTILVVSTAQGMRGLSKSLPFETPGVVPIADVPTGCVCQSKQPAYSCGNAAPTSLLCDRARHERSGVLLA